MAVLLAHSASHFYPHPSEKTITQPFCQPFARWKRFNYSYLINTGPSSSSHQESEPNLNTRKGQQDSSRKKKTLYDHFRTQKAAHCRWHTLPARRFLRFAFFFLSRCCLPACLRTILPLPVTENLFADACHFPNPRGDWPSGTWWPKFRSPWSMWRPKLTHFLHFQVCSPDWLRHL